MFLPKWLVIVLFIVAIGSTGGLLFLLTQRTFSPLNQSSKLSPVIVTSSPATSASLSTTTMNVATSSALPLSATAEWKKITHPGLSLKLEYPANWYLGATDSAQLKIMSFDPKVTTDKMAKDSVQIVITREKKESSSNKLATYLDSRLKVYKDAVATTSVKEENNRKIDTFDAVERVYSSETTLNREIVFATKNYFYLISISPADTLLTAGTNELLKTIEIQ